jgi:hypothetical protein
MYGKWSALTIRPMPDETIRKEYKMTMYRWVEMKNKSVTALLLVAVLFLTTLGAMSQARGDDTHPKLTSKQLHNLIATAKTPEDHEKLAAYYRDKAEQEKAEVAEHEMILAAHNRNPSTHPPAKAAGGPQSIAARSHLRSVRREM